MGHTQQSERFFKERMEEELASLKKTTTQTFQPDLSRGLNYARWKSQPPIKALKAKGLTLSKIQKELKLLHNVSSSAYNRNEILCSKLPLQLLANFCLGLSVTAFIIFVTSLLISGSLAQIKETLNGTDLISQTIIDHMTIRNVLMICAICSVITIIFMFIGIFIMHKDKDSKYNQYIGSILAVHEHIHSKSEDKGIVFKMIQSTKRTKKTNMFGAKKTVKYYSIVIQWKDVKKNEKVVDNNNHLDIHHHHDDDHMVTDDDVAHDVFDENDHHHYFVGSHNAEDHVFDDNGFDEYDFSISDNYNNSNGLLKNKVFNFGLKNGLYLDEIASSTNDCSQFEIATPTLSKIPLLESDDEDEATDNPFV